MNSNDRTEEQTPRPQTVNEAYESAKAAFGRKDFEGAISLCRQILEVAPESFPAFGLLGVSLFQAGKIEEEIGSLKWAIESNSETPWLYANLGELQRVAGDLEAAIASLEHAAAADPDKLFIRVSLGTAHYDKGDFAAAEKEYRRALEMDPGSAPTHCFLGKSLWAAKKWNEAGQAYSTALEHDADFPPACLGLADLLFRLRKSEDRVGNLERAADLALRAIRNGVGNLDSRLLAGKILVELERFEEAKNVLEIAAAESGEKHPDLYVALSVTYARLNEVTKARGITQRLMHEFPMGSRLGVDPEAQVLVLEPLYKNVFVLPLYGQLTHAHTNTISALRPKRVSWHHIFLQGIKKDEIASFKNKYDVIFNNVANSEINLQRGYTESIQYLVEEAGLPVINPPDLNDLATRDQNYVRLHNLDHLIFPKTIQVVLNSDSTSSVLERVETEFEFPVLLRSVAIHNASMIEKVDDIDALRDTLARFADQTCYIIQYHESRYSAESFARYRGAFIGGKFYPGRIRLSGDWLVGNVGTRTNETELTETSNTFRDQEEHWLADPAGKIGQANLAALHAADGILGLDCYGMDFGIAADGRVIVFEANACMNFLAIKKFVKTFPYLAPAAENMQRAMEDLMIDKASGSG